MQLAFEEFHLKTLLKEGPAAFESTPIEDTIKKFLNKLNKGTKNRKPSLAKASPDQNRRILTLLDILKVLNKTKLGVKLKSFMTTLLKQYQVKSLNDDGKELFALTDYLLENKFITIIKEVTESALKSQGKKSKEPVEYKPEEIRENIELIKEKMRPSTSAYADKVDVKSRNSHADIGEPRYLQSHLDKILWNNYEFLKEHTSLGNIKERFQNLFCVLSLYFYIKYFDEEAERKHISHLLEQEKKIEQKFKLYSQEEEKKEGNSAPKTKKSPPKKFDIAATKFMLILIFSKLDKRVQTLLITFYNTHK